MSEAEVDKSLQCQGWRRTGGAFSLGPVTWNQCEEIPAVMLIVKGQTEPMAACGICWNECIETGVEILTATPIKKD